LRCQLPNVLVRQINLRKIRDNQEGEKSCHQINQALFRQNGMQTYSKNRQRHRKIVLLEIEAYLRPLGCRFHGTEVAEARSDCKHVIHNATKQCREYKPVL